MKTITHKTIISLFVLGAFFSFLATEQVSAQFDSSNGWISQDPSTYQYNYGSYTNPNIDTVTSVCSGCNTNTIDASPAISSGGYTGGISSGSYSGGYNGGLVNTSSVGGTYTPGGTYTSGSVYSNPGTSYTPTPITYGNSGTSYTPVTYGNSGSFYTSGSVYGNSGSYYTGTSYTNPVVTTNPITTTIICSDGSTPINGSCNRTNTISTTVNTLCSDGSLPINNSCVRTNTIPTATRSICSDGSFPVNNSCIRVTTIPTIVYQSCWDGSSIPTSSICPLQYKTCPNGTSIPIYQTCDVTPTPVYIAPIVVKFNNVVTSVVTEVTKTSGRCNGIGLIANGAPSTGWFEYGETTNLGRATSGANIGSADTAPFSNVLASLKPSTRYYCRAVMQNQHGLVKGEIVGFTTKSTAVTYVHPTPVRTPMKTSVKIHPKPTITCSDGSTVSIKSETSATMINQGQKLISATIEKIDGQLTSGATVHYKISYKNLADARLAGVLIKITLPQEITFVSATSGIYDEGTRTLTLNQDSLDPYTEGGIIFTGTVKNDAPVGKTIVTNLYVVYTVPGVKTQDEVTAYVIGSIIPNTVITNQDTGAKHVVGTSAKGFMPNSLIEWLALLAIFFIIFILGRSIYASYKDEEGIKHH